MSAPLTTAQCGPESCPVPDGFFFLPPHLAGNAFLLSAFVLLIPFNIYLGVRHRTPLYALFFIAGLLLEAAGHLGRILLREDLTSRSFFTLYMICTTAGPTFVTAAIYVVLPHILAVYGERYCVIPSPLWIGLVFFGFGVFTLAFQIVGCIFSVDGISKPEVGGCPPMIFSSLSPLTRTVSQSSLRVGAQRLTGSPMQKMSQGINILLAGMGIQLLSLVAFFAVYYVFIFRLTRHHEWLDRTHESVYLSPRFRIFLLCETGHTCEFRKNDGSGLCW